MGKFVSFEYRLGYLRASELLNRAFNFGAALTCLLLSAPLLGAIYLIVILIDGRPGIYSGTRLGQGKRPFTMYKFRTLRRGAHQIIGADLLSHRHKVLTRLGRFLRDTRLDELPQLYNVLRGDMDFVGPRPIRPELYEKVCRQIRNYDLRFRTKPGILGLAQLVTPHSTPKKMRSLIDNMLVKKKQRLGWDAWYILVTAAFVCRSICLEAGRGSRECWKQNILGRYREQRDLKRVHPAAGSIWIEDDQTAIPRKGLLRDINEEGFAMTCTEPLQEPYPQHYRLKVWLGNGDRGKGIREARCRGRVYRQSAQSGAWEYVVVYEAESPFSFYILQQYFLHKSIA